MSFLDYAIIRMRYAMQDIACILAIIYVSDHYNLFEKLFAFIDKISL